MRPLEGGHHFSRSGLFILLFGVFYPMSANINTLAVQMSLDEVNALLKQKQKNLKRIETLQERKAELEGQIAEINSEIAALSGETRTAKAAAPAAPAPEKAGKKRGRPAKNAAKKPGRPAKKVGKKRGRPAKVAADAPAAAPKRRGRPPKAASEKRAPAKKKRTGKRTGPSYREMAADALRSLNGEAQLKEIAAIVSERKTGDSNATPSLYTTVSTAMRNAPEFANVGRGRWKLVG